REKLKQPISKNLVSPRYLQRQVRNSLKGVSVRARGPFNVLVRHRFVFQHFKKTAVFCFPLPLSSSYLDQVARSEERRVGKECRSWLLPQEQQAKGLEMCVLAYAGNAYGRSC